MDKRILGVAAIGGIGILGYLLLSKGTVPMLGSADPGTGYTPQDYQDILYALPAEPTVNFPTLPTFQDIFPQERVGDIGSSKKNSSIFTGPSYYGSVPGAQVGSITPSTSSSNVLATAKKEAGGMLFTTMLAGLFGPAGVVVGGLGNLAKDTPLGSSVLDSLSAIVSGGTTKKESTSTLPSGTPYKPSYYIGTSQSGRQVISTSPVSGSRSSGGSSGGSSTLSLASPSQITVKKDASVGALPKGASWLAYAGGG